MIRALVFDIGNVLLKFDFNIAIRRLLPLCGNADAGLLAPIEEIKNAYESGRIGRDTFLKEVFRLLDFRGDEETFIAAWVDIFEVNAPMLDLVERLHGRYPLYLLSNTSDIHMDSILERYPFFGCFTDGVYSYRVGCSKPAPEIYRLTHEQFGIRPEETVFIDDLEANITAAAASGFQAIQYDFRNHAALLERLTALGVEISAPVRCMTGK